MTSTHLVEFGPDIWLSEGPVVPFIAGFPYPTRMAVIKLSDGSLFVWSPIALRSELRREVVALGPVRSLVSPNLLHHLFLMEWQVAFPEARLYASPGLRKRRKDLSFDADLGDAPAPEWAADIDQVLVRGSFVMTEVVFFHRASRTAIFADLIENLPRDSFRGWRGVVARLDGIVSPNAGAPREWRISFINRRAARAALEHILAWPIERVLIAHGDPASTNGATFVRSSFAWLLGRHQTHGMNESPPVTRESLIMGDRGHFLRQRIDGPFVAEVTSPVARRRQGQTQKCKRTRRSVAAVGRKCRRHGSAGGGCFDQDACPPNSR